MFMQLIVSQRKIFECRVLAVLALWLGCRNRSSQTIETKNTVETTKNKGRASGLIENVEIVVSIGPILANLRKTETMNRSDIHAPRATSSPSGAILSSQLRM